MAAKKKIYPELNTVKGPIPVTDDSGKQIGSFTVPPQWYELLKKLTEQGNDIIENPPVPPPSTITNNFLGIGGVLVKFGSYTAKAEDSGKLIVFFNSGPVTLSLPNPPALVNGQAGKWFVFAENAGAGTLTISRTNLTIDGNTNDVSCLTNQGCSVWTDGTNYFTERGISPEDRIVTVALAPTGQGNYTVTHGAGAMPSRVTFELTAGSFLFQSPGYDERYLYLVASDAYAAGVAKVEIGS